MSRSLSVRYFRGDAIPAALLRDLWELRVGLLTLTRSPEEDWEHFSGFVEGPDRCLFAFLDRDGVARGFFTVAFLPVDVEDRKLLLMYSKFFYFQAEYRGHPKTLIAPWRLLWTTRRYGWRSLHFVTTAFPQSYVSLARTSGRVWSLRDEDLAPWRRKALSSFAWHYCGKHFDEDAGVVRGSNVADADSLPRSDEAKALFAQYEALNPTWREGNALPILFSVDGLLVKTSIRRVLRRLRR